MKIQYARHNARIYEVEHNIHFVVQDFLKLDCEKQADFVFIAPPWGGISYSGDENYSVYKSVYPDINAIMKKALSFSRKIILCLPRNIRIEEIVGLLVDSFENSQIISDRACLEIEKIYVNNKYKMNLIYFGNTTKVMRFEGSIFIYFY